MDAENTDREKIVSYIRVHPRSSASHFQFIPDHLIHRSLIDRSPIACSPKAYTIWCESLGINSTNSGQWSLCSSQSAGSPTSTALSRRSQRVGIQA